MAFTLGIIKNISKHLNKRTYLCIEKRYCSNLVDSSNETNFDDIDEYQKLIGLTYNEQKYLLRKKPAFKEGMETLNVALIGAPNAGKSTIANRIIGWKFTSVSEKVHTTRFKTLGVLTKQNKQVVFLDTPGVIVPSKMKKHNLETSLLVDPHEALRDADMIIVVVDVSKLWGKTHLEPEVLKMLHFHKDKESILVLNKVDLLKSKQELLNISRVLTGGHLEGQRYQHTTRSLKNEERKEYKKKMEENEMAAMFEKCRDIKMGSESEEVKQEEISEKQASDSDVADGESSRNLFPLELPTDLDLHNKAHWNLYYNNLQNIGRSIDMQHNWMHFKDVFMISALDGDGILELKSYLMASTKPSPWEFDKNVVTNQNPRILAEQLVFEKLLDNLPSEIPYQIEIKQLLWVVGDDDLLRAQFSLYCTKRRHVEILLGKNGETIQKISREVKQELMNSFRREMSLQLIVSGTKETLPKQNTSPKVEKPSKQKPNNDDDDGGDDDDDDFI